MSLCGSKSGTNGEYAVPRKPIVKLAQNYRKSRRNDNVAPLNSNLLSLFSNFVTFCSSMALKVEQIANTLSNGNRSSKWFKITGKVAGRTVLHPRIQICCHLLEFCHILSLCGSKSGTNSKYSVPWKPIIKMAQNFIKSRRNDSVAPLNSNPLSPFENFVTICLNVALKCGTNSKYAVKWKPIINMAQNYRKCCRNDCVAPLK